jgi:glycosyltransferase involved in cell wall biosynthesis
MSLRYLFLCPDHSHASGGTAVLYECVAQLRQDGHDAVLVHPSASGRYPNSPHDLPTYFSRAIVDTYERRLSRVRRATLLPARVRSHLGPHRNPPLELRPDDILVVPEFWLSLALETFPGRPKVVMVQNPFTYLESISDALPRGLDPGDGHLLSIGCAQSCMDALKVAGVAEVAYCRVQPDFTLFPYRESKSRRIAYMPRKRPREAELVRRALEGRGKLAGYELVCVDGMTQPQVAEVLGDCRFFLSLMERESLGFPGLEAMASGCIVVGYTGMGAREYFTPDTGRPVAEGDTFGLVAALEQAIAEYDRDPAPLDALRRNASTAVTSTYTREAFLTGLRAAWDRLPAVRDRRPAKVA